MDRREALQRAGLLLGYAIGGSSLAGVLAGCAAPKAPDWTPIVLTPAQGETLRAMVEHLLPETDTAGALELGVDRFIDAMLSQFCSSDEQHAFSTGLQAFDADCREAYRRPFEQLAAWQRDVMFRKYEQAAPPLPPTVWGAPISDNVPVPAFYRKFKELALLGYFTSEQIGKHALKYDPVPGRFDGCVPLADIGGQWTEG